MKLPRDTSGPELAKALRVLGYEITRQKGSHVRLTTQVGGEHHITIPNHRPLRIGTLASLLDEISAHFGISRDALLSRLDL